MDSLPAGWHVEGEDLVTTGAGGDLGGDIITRQQFESFELELEWAMSPGGNSGIFFHVVEDGSPAPYYTGPEYQLIDDVGFPEHLEEWQMAAANYAMHPAVGKVLKPVGEFNTSGIVVNDREVVHYLNGKEVVRYTLWTEDWYRRVNEGKWKNYPSYGRALYGAVGLQDHGSPVRFRNIRIRDLTDYGHSVFPGPELQGWHTEGNEKWYTVGDTLVCESGPDKGYGYLVTDSLYQNFVFRCKFRQLSDGNSGVFFHTTFPDGSIKGWQAEIAPPGLHTGAIYESHDRGWISSVPTPAEDALDFGQWNELVVRVENDRVMTWLNGRMVTDLTDPAIAETNGHIALQIHSGGGVKIEWTDLFIRQL
ncbi:MAG: hypothetical protein Kow00127_11330 [Bacteroidales bacterium]